MQRIIIYLTNYSSSVPLSLSLFLSSISLSSICMSIWSSLCFVNNHRILNSWAQLWHSCIYFCCTGLEHICSVLFAESRQMQFLFQLEASLQTHHVDSTLKRCGNYRFHVVSTCNPRGVFVGMVDLSDFSSSFLSQPYSHRFSSGGLPITQFFHMIATWCDSLIFIWRVWSVGRRLLSAGGVADFLHHQSS